MNMSEISLATHMIKDRSIPENSSPLEVQSVRNVLIRDGILLNAASMGNPNGFILSPVGEQLCGQSEEELSTDLIRRYMDSNEKKTAILNRIQECANEHTGLAYHDFPEFNYILTTMIRNDEVFGEIRNGVAIASGINTSRIQDPIVQETIVIPKKTFFEHFTSWYGVIGTTVTLLGFWIALWQIWKVWFFGF